jgi:hypothetical protein
MLIEPPATHWIRGWAGPRTGLDAMEKRKILPPLGIEPQLSSLQPVTIQTELSQLISPCMKIKIMFTHSALDLIWHFKYNGCMIFIYPGLNVLNVNKPDKTYQKFALLNCSIYRLSSVNGAIWRSPRVGNIRPREQKNNKKLNFHPDHPLSSLNIQ